MMYTTSENIVVSISPSSGVQNFATRRSQSGVVRWYGFDQTSEIGSTSYPSNFGVTAGFSTPVSTGMPVVDLTKSASSDGGGSLKFTVPPDSPANENAADAGVGVNGSYCGGWYTNFFTDVVANPGFGEGETFYVQWRQWFSDGQFGGLDQMAGKIAHIGTGDYGTNATQAFGSCSTQEVVVQDTGFGFPQMYHVCPSEGFSIVFEDGQSSPWNSFNFNMENGRASPYCFRYVANANVLGGGIGGKYRAGNFSPIGTCFSYAANQWMSFKIGITLGALGTATMGPYPNTSVYLNSRVRLWIGLQGQASELIIDRTGHLMATASNQSGGPQYTPAKFGKLWFNNRWTGFNSSTFLNTAVDVTNNTIVGGYSAWITGQEVKYKTATGVAIGGLDIYSTHYWVIRVNSTTIKLASSLANAMAEVAIDLTSQGGAGDHTLVMSHSGYSFWYDEVIISRNDIADPV